MFPAAAAPGTRSGFAAGTRPRSPCPSGALELNSADHVIFVLQVVLAVGPLAVYLLTLGLVNSQARPCLVTSRADFTLLAVAFVPVIVWPVVTLVRSEHVFLAAGAVAGVTALFLAMLPGRDAGWVIYHVSPSQSRRLLEQACRRLGWRVASVQDEPAADRSYQDAVVIQPGRLLVTQDALPWLRNVTIRIASAGPEPQPRVDPVAREHLVKALFDEIQRESMLPSPTGASLMLIGAALLGVPMWYLFNHIELIVEAVKRLLFA